MRRRRPHRHVNHERWLVSYADFITLLFAFFVVMYSSAQVDQRRMGRLSWAIHLAFQEMGVFPDGNSHVPPIPLQLPFDTGATLRLPEKTSPPTIGGGGSGSNDPDLAILQDQLTQQLSGELALHSVAIHREQDGLVLSLREFGFFESGSANIQPAALPVLDRIASLLAIRTYRFRIEGHTDNVPIHNRRTDSNWELSSNRAAALVRLLIVRHGFAPERMAAAGYAEYHPVASNATKEGRAQNRRVDVVILGSLTSFQGAAEPDAPPASPATPSPNGSSPN